MPCHFLPRSARAISASSFFIWLAGAFSLGAGGCGGSDTKPPPALGDPADIMSDLPRSCAFACSDCAEPEQPYACPTLKPWGQIPHAQACGNWDGRHPDPVAGSCTASDPTGEAVQKAGPIPGGVV